MVLAWNYIIEVVWVFLLKVIFGTGVSVALDPRTVGTQMDDSIMQKNLATKILIKDIRSIFYQLNQK